MTAECIPSAVQYLCDLLGKAEITWDKENELLAEAVIQALTTACADEGCLRGVARGQLVVFEYLWIGYLTQAIGGNSKSLKARCRTEDRLLELASRISRVHHDTYRSSVTGETMPTVEEQFLFGVEENPYRKKGNGVVKIYSGALFEGFVQHLTAEAS